jgi:hypothetical protein
VWEGGADMNGWLIFLGSTGILGVLIWFTSLRIRIVYKRAAENDRIDVEVSMYRRLLKYRFTVNMLQIESLSKGVKVSQKAEVGQKGQAKERKKMWITPRTIKRMQRKFVRLLRNVYDLNEIMRHTLKYVRGEMLEWRTSIGLGEASATGASVGAVWAIKSSIIAVLAHYISLTTQPRLYVLPEFHREMLDTHLVCILRFRIGHAIIAVIRIAVHYFLKGRERVWENIRFKA